MLVFPLRVMVRMMVKMAVRMVVRMVVRFVVKYVMRMVVRMVVNMMVVNMMVMVRMIHINLYKHLPSLLKKYLFCWYLTNMEGGGGERMSFEKNDKNHCLKMHFMTLRLFCNCCFLPNNPPHSSLGGGGGGGNPTHTNKATRASKMFVVGWQVGFLILVSTPGPVLTRNRTKPW